MTRYIAFCKIIECGSFTRAAEVMGYTQAAVSQMIRSLENEFSMTLLTRTRTGVKMTPEGSALYPIIRKYVSVYRELGEKVGELNGLESGEVRMGTFSSISQKILPGVMLDFRGRYSGISFVLSEGDNTTIPEWIKNGLVDIGFVYPEASSGLNCLPLIKDEYLAVLPVNHPFASRDSISLEDMASQPLIVVEEGECNTVLNAFEAISVFPHVQYRIHDDYTILSMIEKGIGVSILPSMILDKAPYAFKAVPISTPVFRTVGVAFGNRDMLPIAAKKFVSFLSKHIGDYLPEKHIAGHTVFETFP